MVERGLVGFFPNSAFQPWYFLPQAEVFSVTGRWPNVRPDLSLTAFARRQDCDMLACFVESNSTPPSIAVANGWTSSGYEILNYHASIWEWFKLATDDVRDWSELGE
jgi:hypothetical protein